MKGTHPLSYLQKLFRMLPEPMADTIFINNHLQIPTGELQFRFARSGGKGGQNVNKVETKVELLFDVRNSPSLSDSQRSHIIERLKSHTDSNGIVHIIAQESRSQWQNREIAVQKFVDSLQKALKPRKKRIATKISKGAKERRLETKKHRGNIKRLRKFDTE